MGGAQRGREARAGALLLWGALVLAQCSRAEPQARPSSSPAAAHRGSWESRESARLRLRRVLASRRGLVGPARLPNKLVSQGRWGTSTSVRLLAHKVRRWRPHHRRHPLYPHHSKSGATSTTSQGASPSVGPSMPGATGQMMAAEARPPAPQCTGMKKPGFWDSMGPTGGFRTYGCLGVSGIHVAQTYMKTIVVIDRTDSQNTNMKFPGTNQNAYGEEVTLPLDDTKAWPSQRPLDVKSNVFCSSGQFLPDGSLISIGGTSDALNADPMLNGSLGVRLYKPCATNNCHFQLSGTMTSKRWYPTAQLLPDGRVLIVGGANTYGNIAINDNGRNNPTVEYWPRKPDEGNHYVQFLADTVPFNLYPFVHVLPSGKVFLFAQDSYTLYDTTMNQEVLGNYPRLSRTVQYKSQTVPIYRSYPVSGASAMLPLSSASNWTAEIMICGGNNNKATYVNGDRKRSTGENGRIPADFSCARIKPEVPNPQWVDDWMCYDQPASPTCKRPLRRVMGDMVILADGSILILNGATQGYQGLSPKFAQQAQMQPIIWNTASRSWYPPAQLPPSHIPRMYHSSAILLHDASVLISGSNPNPKLDLSTAFPTEFRMEKFMPPYFYTGRQRPQLLTAPQAATVGSVFSLSFNTTQKSGTALKKRFSVSLCYPGFSTHNQRHGMRHVFLDVLAVSAAPKSLLPNGFYAIVAAPKNVNIAPPSLYWIHVLDDGVPNIQGAPINITRTASSSTKPKVQW